MRYLRQSRLHPLPALYACQRRRASDRSAGSHLRPLPAPPS